MTEPLDLLVNGPGADAEQDINPIIVRSNEHSTRLDDLEASRLLGSDLDNVSGGSTTSLTYTSTLTTSTDDPVQCDFVAPASGAVEVHLHALLDPQTAIEGFVGFEIRVVSPDSLFLAPTESRSLMKFNTNQESKEGAWPVTGLTPGVTYRAIMMFKLGAAGTLNVSPYNLWVTAL